ncbi:MAG: peptidoglycan-binding protein [Candidatus Omnitrophica bacterium]|nr:peptidoglycan-binding protein [Candidatus Omnitrophota bacterium]
MKRYYLVIMVILALDICLLGCKKKQPELKELQTPISTEIPTVLPEQTPISLPARSQEITLTPSKIEPPIPQGPYKPTNEEIQLALKNAGFYTGAIDGKIGPLTKKAIEEFQKANGLQVDGIVGPKTWAVLSRYLNPPTAEIPTKGTLKKR